MIVSVEMKKGDCVTYPHGAVLEMLPHLKMAFVDYHGLSWSIMIYNGLSWTIMDYPLLPQLPKFSFFHGLIWTIMDYHDLFIGICTY